MAMITTTRFKFDKAKGTDLAKDNPLWLCVACLSLGVIIGFVGGLWVANPDSTDHGISDETMERIRLGIENIKLQRLLDEKSKEMVP